MSAVGQDTSFTVSFFFHFFVFTVMDFSAGALPTGVKFYMAVRPHFRQVFSHFGVDSPRNGRILGVNMRKKSIFWALKQPISHE